MDTIINEKLDRSGCKILQDLGWSKIDGNVFQSKSKKIQQTNEYNKKAADTDKENKLMVTDYSSVSYDFAYLKKPVIYAQFDIDTFFEGHTYTKGYFDDERDGFGPVCYNYEDTVNSIIKYIENDCKMDEKYEKRVNDFYYRFDTDNCKRVYKAILKI